MYQPVGTTYVNALAKLALPPGVVTATLFAPTVPAGVTAVTLVDETTTTLVAATPPTVTLVAPVKLVPVIVIAVPPAVEPVAGETEEMAGSGVLTTRNPTLTSMRKGVMPTRRDARQWSETSAQTPPRNKRDVPVVGPVGLVTLPDE